MHQEGGLSIVMKEIGILFVAVAGIEKKQEWSVKLWAMIQHILVILVLTLNTANKF